MKFYIDTSIWMDLDMNRKGFKGEPLGDYAARLLIKIMANDYAVIITDILIKELETYYPQDKINSFFQVYTTEKIISSEKQRKEAIDVSRRGVPKGDALHAIIARDGDLVMVTRDKHFKQMEDICTSYRPEELI